MGGQWVVRRVGSGWYGGWCGGWYRGWYGQSQAQAKNIRRHLAQLNIGADVAGDAARSCVTAVHDRAVLGKHLHPCHDFLLKERKKERRVGPNPALRGVKFAVVVGFLRASSPPNRPQHRIAPQSACGNHGWMSHGHRGDACAWAPRVENS